MTGAAEVEALLATIDAAASGFTLCHVAPGVRLAGTSFPGVSVLQVLHGTMQLDLPGGDRRIARAGQLVLMPGGAQPMISCAGTAPTRTMQGRECLVRRDGWLIADAARGQPAALVVAAARMTGTTERSLDAVLVTLLTERPEGRQALAMLRAEVARSSPGSTTLAVTLMSACIVIGLRIALARDATHATVRKVDRRGAIERAIAAVRSRPADPHDLDTLADAAGMSRSTLTRHFRKVLGTTPATFVQRARLTEAAALLRATDLPVKSIAAATGFSSRSHFSQTFTGVYGTDPSSYRARPSTDALGSGTPVTQPGALPGQ